MAEVLHSWGALFSKTNLEIFDDGRVGFGGYNVYEGLWGGYCTYEEFLAGTLAVEVRSELGQEVLLEAIAALQKIVGTTQRPEDSLLYPEVPSKPQTPENTDLGTVWQSSDGFETLSLSETLVTSSGMDAYGSMQGETFSFEDLLAGKHIETLVSRHGAAAVEHMLAILRKMKNGLGPGRVT